MTTRTTPTGGTQNLTWDDAGHLTSIAGGTAGTTQYVYGPDGSVLLQKDPGTTTLYLPGEQLSLNTSTGVLSGTRYYALRGGGTAVRTATTGATSTYSFEIPDRHGTSGLALDSTAQTPTWRQFTPYGVPRGTTTSWVDNRGFLNAPANTSTGLTVLGARQYDPTIARFISLDPVFEATDPQQLGGYNYASSNPVGKSDPTGRMAYDPDTGVAAGTTSRLQQVVDEIRSKPNYKDSSPVASRCPEREHYNGHGCGANSTTIKISDHLGISSDDPHLKSMIDAWNDGSLYPFDRIVSCPLGGGCVEPVVLQKYDAELARWSSICATRDGVCSPEFTKLVEALSSTVSKKIHDVSNGFLCRNVGSCEWSKVPEAAETFLTSPGAIARSLGYSTKEIKTAIHGVKGQGGWRGIGGNKNPDIAVELETGEVYPQLPGGGIADESIGNIFDFLPEDL